MGLPVSINLIILCGSIVGGVIATGILLWFLIFKFFRISRNRGIVNPFPVKYLLPKKVKIIKDLPVLHRYVWIGSIKASRKVASRYDSNENEIEEGKVGELPHVEHVNQKNPVSIKEMAASPKKKKFLRNIRRWASNLSIFSDVINNEECKEVVGDIENVPTAEMLEEGHLPETSFSQEMYQNELEYLNVVEANFASTSLVEYDEYKRGRIISESRQEVRSQLKAQSKEFGIVDSVELNSGPDISMVPLGWQVENSPPLILDKALVMSHVMVKWNLERKAVGWFMGTIVASCNRPYANYVVKFVRAVTSNVFVDGVYAMNFMLNGLDGYGVKWVLLRVDESTLQKKNPYTDTKYFHFKNKKVVADMDEFYKEEIPKDVARRKSAKTFMNNTVPHSPYSPLPGPTRNNNKVDIGSVVADIEYNLSADLLPVSLLHKAFFKEIEIPIDNEEGSFFEPSNVLSMENRREILDIPNNYAPNLERFKVGVPRSAGLPFITFAPENF